MNGCGSGRVGSGPTGLVCVPSLAAVSRRRGPEGGWQLAPPTLRGGLFLPDPLVRTSVRTDAVARGQTRTGGPNFLYLANLKKIYTILQYHNKHLYFDCFSVLPLL